MPIHQIRGAKPYQKAICSGKCVLAEKTTKKHNSFKGTMGILCQSASRRFLLPPRPQSQQHSCGHKATSDRQRDGQADQATDLQTNKGRQ